VCKYLKRERESRDTYIANKAEEIRSFLFFIHDIYNQRVYTL